MSPQKRKRWRVMAYPTTAGAVACARKWCLRSASDFNPWSHKAHRTNFALTQDYIPLSLPHHIRGR